MADRDVFPARVNRPRSTSPARRKSIFTLLVAIALVLSFAVTVLSSVMRLTNLGLGCAGWPECYGVIAAPGYGIEPGPSGAGAGRSQAFFPNSIVARGHRAVASLLLLSIIAIAVIAWRQRGDPQQPVAVPMALLGLSLFLALLGAWFGSPLLRPPVMLANLLGGMAMVGLLWWLYLSVRGIPSRAEPRRMGAYRLWAILGLAAVVAQTALGGWMSGNFAALACTTVPDCNGLWWPSMDFSAGFSPSRTLEVDTAGKVIIDQAAVTAIHVGHRIGAVFVLLFVGGLGYKALRSGGRIAVIGIAILALLLAQASLGIAIVAFSAPLPVVVAHNAVAVLLWLALIGLIRSLSLLEV
jgi:cytochrome c oxidase assembly protein subunit 15